jgi:hypothetical protein
MSDYGQVDANPYKWPPESATAPGAGGREGGCSRRRDVVSCPPHFALAQIQYPVTRVAFP